MRRYLAVDLGAESGRLMIGELDGGSLQTREVHRFPNDPVEYNRSLHWDVLRIWHEIRCGLKGLGTTQLDGIAVDAWGVDYALLGDGGELLANPHHYRDRRTDGVLDQLLEHVPAEDIYETTGIQFMPINTLVQLFSARAQSPQLLAVAERLLTIPDLFHFWLTGNAVCEATNASTTQMLDARTRRWATTLLDRLDLPSHLPAPIIESCSHVGGVLRGVSPELAGTPVIAPASHDTGSAVAAIEARDGTAFISSGTWSLVGIELDEPVINEAARRLNFTNEGGVCGTTRLLKNVMGLWMLQGCRKSWANRGTNFAYDELAQAALSTAPFQACIDPNHPSFLRPDCMLSAIDRYCDDTGQKRLRTPAAYVRTVLESLALRYRVVVSEIEELTGQRVQTIRVIGGGSKNDVLNQFTADATGRRVLAGPVEATALGNLAAQMMASGAAKSISECREIIGRSHEARIFEPRGTAAWEQQLERTLCLKQ